MPIPLLRPVTSRILSLSFRILGKSYGIAADVMVALKREWGIEEEIVYTLNCRDCCHQVYLLVDFCIFIFCFHIKKILSILTKELSGKVL